MDTMQTRDLLSPKKNPDKEWFLSLLDEGRQLCYEIDRLSAVLAALKSFYLTRIRRQILEYEKEIARLKDDPDYSAADYRTVLELQAKIAGEERKRNSYRCFFSEPYFARMDVTDEKEGYNSYYIGKKGDVNLEIVDWRAPLAVRYYQKSRVSFSINEYEYKTVLRRALSVKNGKLLSFKNEYLSVKDYLSPEEIGGRDEEILFDPYLKSIIESRKNDDKIRDIIQTIQEQQFEIVNKPERESFVLQGCAGSGKTMILLHRLSYLMYNNESLSPRDVLVITPSDSFNAFIDELSQVLELQKVKTTTLGEYFYRALENEKIDIKSKLNGERESFEYLAFLYSAKFPAAVKKKIATLYDGLAGLFVSEECREISEKIGEDCAVRNRYYDKIKNASLRVRRAVLGEMKDNGTGGFYFTKPFRTLMSAYGQVEEFVSFVLKGEPSTPDKFFRRYVEFYHGAQYVSAHADGVFERALADIAALKVAVSKEIDDLKRYKIRSEGEEVYTYRERIAHREELLAECDRTERTIGEMRGGTELFCEFFSVVRFSGVGRDLGRCKDKTDIARWLYRETVKKYKKKYGMNGLYPSDGYALCAVLAESGRQLYPRYGLVFVDEGQDISEGEYALLKKIHSDAAFNVFGDLKQNITPFRGIGDWGILDGAVYTLDRNYRNTDEIVEFVSNVVDVGMRPIGFHGEPVRTIPPSGTNAFFRGKQGLKAVIVKEEYLPLFDKRGYSRLAKKGLSKTKINVMTVYESKGLEFSVVAVYDRGMSENEKYVSYTRALKELAIVREK